MSKNRDGLILCKGWAGRLQDIIFMLRDRKN